nr:hypothetical protein [Nocardia albiluteola]
MSEIARLSDLIPTSLILAFECRCRGEQLVLSPVMIGCGLFGEIVALVVVVHQRPMHRIGDRTIGIGEFLEPSFRDLTPLSEFFRCHSVLRGDPAQLIRVGNQSFGHACLIPPAS